MMPRPKYPHPIHMGSLGRFIGTITGADGVEYDIWVVDESFVRRWSSNYKDAEVIEDPLMIALLRTWSLGQVRTIVDRLEKQVTETRRLTTAIEGVKFDAHHD